MDEEVVIDQVEKGKSILRPRARIIQTIGEDLISNDSVAVLELVKNSYDADASEVEIIFEGEIKEGKGKIIIKDDGSGMDLKTLKIGWMEPATVIKKKGNQSKGGRRFLGEKGVGRFASARLSKKLIIVTKSEEKREIKAKFDWGDFNNDEKYLDEILCSWEVGDYGEIKNKGTIIYLEELNTSWDWEKLEILKNSLSRLVNPLLPVKDFKINLILPSEFEKFSGEITAPEILERPDYKIQGGIDLDGNIKITYSSNNLIENEIIEKVIEIDNSRIPLSGPFDFEFRVWDRDIEILKEHAAKIGGTLKSIRKDLDEVSGVNIYRDGFRVLPYGDKKYDWLRLDLRRVQNPTMRISNNQVMGYISISLDKNPELRDQSNREGLIDSPAFEDLKKVIKSIFGMLESRRYQERRKEPESKITEQSLFSDINISPVFDMVKRKLPNDAEATLVLIKTDEKIQKGLKKIQEVLSRYRRLSTLGLLIDAVLHDGNTFLSRTSNELLILEKELRNTSLTPESLKKHFDLINRERDALANLFKRLEPFSGRRPRQKKEILLEESIRNVFELFSGDLKRLKIKTKLPTSDTMIKVNNQDIQTIILNFLHNSIFWLEKEKNKERLIEVEVSRENPKELIILFSDNGPGINEKDIPYIFDPYFSTKPDGIGLGLTIAGELMAEYGGILELVRNNSLSGTCFRMKFKIEDGKSKDTNDR